MTSKEELYQASVREGQAAARACRRAWANYRKRHTVSDRKKRQSDDKQKAVMTEGAICKRCEKEASRT